MLWYTCSAHCALICGWRSWPEHEINQEWWEQLGSNKVLAVPKLLHWYLAWASNTRYFAPHFLHSGTTFLQGYKEQWIASCVTWKWKISRVVLTAELNNKVTAVPKLLHRYLCIDRQYSLYCTSFSSSRPMILSKSKTMTREGNFWYGKMENITRDAWNWVKPWTINCTEAVRPNIFAFIISICYFAPQLCSRRDHNSLRHL